MIDPSFKSYAHGKLLLTGEYFVLDGALALAVPTKLGQHFTIEQTDEEAGLLDWISLDKKGVPWFNARFSKGDEYYTLDSSDESTAERLCQLLNTAVRLQKDTRLVPSSRVQTRLEFHRSWGLGSSSTLVSVLSNWLNIDPYALLKNTFGGSGYDLACATANGPIFYQFQDGRPEDKEIVLDWPFKDHLFFVYLEKKQDSREGIQQYRNRSSNDSSAIQDRISTITRQISTCNDLTTFCTLIDKHETIIAEHMDRDRVQKVLFDDFNGCIKSLGAWGGDFILAACDLSPQYVNNYFSGQGYATVLPWKDIILEDRRC